MSIMLFGCRVSNSEEGGARRVVSAYQITGSRRRRRRGVVVLATKVSGENARESE
jgi:hypothetical protein